MPFTMTDDSHPGRITTQEQRDIERLQLKVEAMFLMLEELVNAQAEYEQSPRLYLLSRKMKQARQDWFDGDKQEEKEAEP